MGTNRAGKLTLRPRAVARNEYMQLNNYLFLTTSGCHGAHAASKFNFLGQSDWLIFAGFPKGKPSQPRLNQGRVYQAVVLAIVSIL